MPATMMMLQFCCISQRIVKVSEGTTKTRDSTVIPSEIKVLQIFAWWRNHEMILQIWLTKTNNEHKRVSCLVLVEGVWHWRQVGDGVKTSVKIRINFLRAEKFIASSDKQAESMNKLNSLNIHNSSDRENYSES